MSDLERSVRAAIPGQLVEKVQALPPPVRSLYRTILNSFVTTGRSPDPDALEHTAKVSGVDAPTALGTLTDLDVIVAAPGPDRQLEVRVAYPFSADPTPHRVAIDGGPTVYAMCAIDALGIPPMLHRSGVAMSVEPETAAAVEVQIQDGTATWRPSDTAVLLGRSAACAHAANGICPFINFFTSPQSAQSWITRHPAVEVWHLDQDTALRLAIRTFGDLLTVATA
jgi:hypothetical protein